MTIESNRSLGGIAAVLTLLGIFSQLSTIFRYAFPNSLALDILFSGAGSLFGILAFVGFILFLIAMYGFSKDYNDHRIFSYLLYGIIITIVAAIIVGIIFVLVILLNFASIFPSSSASSSPQISSSMTRIFGYILPIFGLVGVIWVAFNVKAFNLLSDKSKVPFFRIGAKVLLAGAIANIVLAIIFAVAGLYVSLSLNALLALLTVGSIIQDVAWVLFAMAYFRIQAPVAPVQTAPLINVPLVSGQVKYCTHCGAPNQPDALYCTRCGQKL